MPAQSSGTANRITVLKEEPKSVPEFLSRDWVVDPNLSLGEVQVGVCGFLRAVICVVGRLTFVLEHDARGAEVVQRASRVQGIR